MLAFLRKPYPYNGTVKSVLVFSVLIGVFIALFLLIFQPFGTAQWEHPNKPWILLGFGLVTTLISALVQLILIRFANKDRWTVWKEALSTMGVILLIAIGNIFYSAFLGNLSADWHVYLFFILNAFLIAFFPVTLSIVAKHNRYLQLNRKMAAEVNSSLAHTFRQEEQVPDSGPQLLFKAENEKDSFSIAMKDLLYIQSADNYSEIVYEEKQGVKKYLLRSSLKRLESQQLHPKLQRCHRSYIVNMNRVNHVEGNAQGYILSLDGTDTPVPVSRNYSSTILPLLK